LALLESRKQKASFIQVGACDGNTHDPVYDIIKRGFFDAVLIEPIPRNFSALKKSYEGVEHVKFINAAVGTSSGEATIYTVRNEGRWKDSEWARQWASFDKNHLFKHGVAEEEIENCQIKCITMEELSLSLPGEKIDVLQIDTEGYDAKVVEMALNLQNLPSAIYFEFVHISHLELHDIFQKLDRAGYVWSFDKNNVLCLHSKFLSSF
jgi:FkbM family methyltransferase